MDIESIINRYIDISFSMNKCGESLINSQIGGVLTYDQHYTLRYIYKQQSCTSTELAEVFDVKKSAITAIITRLWEKGLIERTRDESDRRIVYLSLTAKGKELYEKVEERIYKLVESLIGRFDYEEIKQFMDSYAKLNQVLMENKETFKMEEAE